MQIPTKYDQFRWSKIWLPQRSKHQKTRNDDWRNHGLCASHDKGEEKLLRFAIVPLQNLLWQQKTEGKSLIKFTRPMFGLCHITGQSGSRLLKVSPCKVNFVNNKVKSYIFKIFFANRQTDGDMNVSRLPAFSTCWLVFVNPLSKIVNDLRPFRQNVTAVDVVSSMIINFWRFRMILTMH